ncbi:MAG: hypothetical protein IJ217_01015 [Clostridia bacterium]|nr:hypothetical protein [Clostridia bacterium]
MRVFLIDQYQKNYDILKKLQDSGIENVEMKGDCKVRATKNDFVIVFGDGEMEGLFKTANVIIVTNNKAPNYLWKMIHEYHCVDIIDESLDRAYLAERIAKQISIRL